MAVDLTRANALNTTADLAEAGATFNDATRLLDGGLWANPTDNNGQQNYLGSFLADIHAVQNDINSALTNGATINAAAFTLTPTETTLLQQVSSQLTTEINAAPMSVGPHGIAGQTILHNTQTAILNEINGDAGLATALGNATYAANTGANDAPFQALAVGSDAAAAVTAAVTPGATLAQVGSVFNAAADLAVGGLNHTNLAQFNSDMQAVQTGLNNIINNPTTLAAIENGETPQAAALTTIHLQTLANQTNLQINQFDNQFNSNPTVATRGTNDNILDMIDIVQNDANLNTAAGGNGQAGHTGGFAEQPGFLTGTVTPFVDNQAQTNFWSQFLSEANNLNTNLQGIAANGITPAAAQSLITELQNYNSFGASFAAGQNGVFAARFENELTNGTLKADTANAIQGLQGITNGDTGTALAHDQAQILAAGQGFVADAMDVSGNNIPSGGGTYVGTATTVATATTPNNIAMGTIPVTGPANPHTGLATTPDLQHLSTVLSMLSTTPTPAVPTPTPTPAVPIPIPTAPIIDNHLLDFHLPQMPQIHIHDHLV